jgi:hypothetical protein
MSPIVLQRSGEPSLIHLGLVEQLIRNGSVEVSRIVDEEAGELRPELKRGVCIAIRMLEEVLSGFDDRDPFRPTFGSAGGVIDKDAAPTTGEIVKKSREAAARVWMDTSSRFSKRSQMASNSWRFATSSLERIFRPATPFHPRHLTPKLSGGAKHRPLERLVGRPAYKDRYGYPNHI